MNCIKGHLLYFISESHVLCYYQSALYDVDLTNGHKELIVRLPIIDLKGFFGRIRLLERLFRLEPRTVEKLNANRYVICYRKGVWLLDIRNKTFDLLQSSGKGFSNPLNFCSDGEYIYWGDYGDNSNHEAVNIYRVDSTLKLQIVYTFPNKSIRHIHNVVYDSYSDRFFILTGDLEDNAGIYVATENWQNVNPIVTGEQKYRAVVGFSISNGLIYATDAVEEDNHIFLLQDNRVKPLCDFPGSCIYGTDTNSHYVFASTVEPSEGRGLLNMFTNKLGKGIQDRYVHLVTVRKSDFHVEEIFNTMKDIWPMKLFQYGTLMFPKGQEKLSDLWYYVMACKGDGYTYSVRL